MDSRRGAPQPFPGIALHAFFTVLVLVTSIVVIETALLCWANKIALSQHKYDPHKILIWLSALTDLCSENDKIFHYFILRKCQNLYAEKFQK